MSDIPEIKVPPVVAPQAEAALSGEGGGGGMLAYRTPEELQVPAGWTHAEIFTLAPERLASYIAVVVAFRLAAFLVMMVTVFALFWNLFKPGDMHRWVANMLIMASMLAVLQMVTLWRQWMKAKRVWGGYKLIVADQGFLQNTPGEAPLTIQVSEVRRVTEEWDAFRVWVGRRCVILPKRVEGVERLREWLNGKWPIAKGSGGGRTIATVAFSLVMIVVMLAALGGSMMSDQKLVVGGCLVVVMAWAGWCLWRVMRVVNMPLVTKIMSLVMMGFIIFYAVAKLAFELLRQR